MNNIKNILITSGGTKIKIDMVRNITNMSKGTFGSNIADCAFDTIDNVNIYFLGAVNSKKPFFSKNGKSFLNQQLIEKNKIDFVNVENKSSFHIIPYETFEDYEKELFTLLKEINFDIIILAAAVSDYTVENYVNGKIRSNNELVIKLKPLPKLIERVREFQPLSTICGFKLLVNSSENELKDACINSLIKNKIDLVVGNDLRDIKNDNHTLIIGESINNDIIFSVFDKKNYCLPNVVISKCMESLNRKNSKNV